LTYEYRSLHQLNDSTSYFLDKIEQIGAETYVPTEEDVIYSHSRTTTGVVEGEFKIDGYSFRMIDVSGQRNDRRKWIHCFSEDVLTCVLFVVPLNVYDMYDEDGTNLMQEALNLFEEICNSRWFRKTSVLLLLNKRDLFAEKIRKVPLTKCFPDYDGLNTYEATTQFIQRRFEERNRDSYKQVYSHLICAVDQGNMARYWNDMRHIVIRTGSYTTGLLG